MKKIWIAITALLSLTFGYAQYSVEDKVLTPAGSFQEERSLYKQSLATVSGMSTESAIKPKYAIPQLLHGMEVVDAFIAIESEAAIDRLKAEGVRVECVFDGFVMAKIPLERMQAITALPGVLDVSVSKMMDFCTDSTMSVTHVDDVLQGPAAGLPAVYDGSGVVVGIVDAGFDYQHEAFKRADDPSRSRLVRVYDQANTTGHPVIIDGETLDGSVFMGEQIDTLTTDCEGTHGTHTASIAAGTHVHGYGGMAPGADIVLCSARSMNSGLQESEIIRGIRYIYAYADSVGKPCVISLSVSTSYGSHDGRDYLSRVIEQSSGPRHIFVIAAGNNAFWPYSISGLASEAKPINILLDCPNYNTDEGYYYSAVRTDSWMRDIYTKAGFKFHILDKQTGRIVWESSPVTTTGTFSAAQFGDYYEPDPNVRNGIGYMSAQISADIYSTKYNISTTISNLKSKSYIVDGAGKSWSRYLIGISIYPRKTTNSCYVDSWMPTGGGRYFGREGTVWVDSITDGGDTVSVARDNYYLWPTSNISINSNAVNDSVISAGSFAARNTYFSLNADSVRYTEQTIGTAYYTSGYEAQGCGPTGKALPTVMAPGVNVIAAASRYSYFETNTIHPNLVLRADNGCLWGAMTGTSMAAPTVAGIIAQWLQINPDLSIAEIKDIIAKTAIKDEFTLSRQFGPNGKIDALAGIKYLITNSSDWQLGDVNGDGFVDIRDLSLLIDYLLTDGQDIPMFVKAAADVQMDGEIGIKDVSALIDILLQSDSSETNVEW